MSAREDLQEAMYGSCFSREAVDRAIDAFAHELAEQIRGYSSSALIRRGKFHSEESHKGMSYAADLIDPEVQR